MERVAYPGTALFAVPTLGTVPSDHKSVLTARLAPERSTGLSWS